MKFGLCLPIRRDCSLEFNIDLAVMAEQLGFDSVWVSDHVIMPGRIKGTFSSIFYDPFVLMTAISAKTSRIKLGTSVIVLPYRHPVVVAKMISTLDVLSEGRVIFGVAPGWLKEEFDVLNADFKNRGKVTDEYMQAISELWRNENPVYKGEFANFSDIDFFPKPHNGRIPEIWVGGGSKYAVNRALKYGNGWQPTWVSPDDFLELKKYLDSKAKEMGVGLDNFVLSVRNRIRFEEAASDEESNIYMFSGTVEEILSQVYDFRKAGVEYIIFDPETSSDTETVDMIGVLSEGIIKKFE